MSGQSLTLPLHCLAESDNKVGGQFTIRYQSSRKCVNHHEKPQECGYVSVSLAQLEKFRHALGNKKKGTQQGDLCEVHHILKRHPLTENLEREGALSLYVIEAVVRP